MRFCLKHQTFILAYLVAACSVYGEDLLLETASSTTSNSTSDATDSTSSTSSSPLTTGTTSPSATPMSGAGGTTDGAETSSGGGVTGDTSSTSDSGAGGQGSTTTTGGGAGSGGGGAGSGGSGGSGGSEPTTTTTTTTSTTTGSSGTGGVSADPLSIDDLEDGDGQLDPNFTGYWYMAMASSEEGGEGEITAPADPDAPVLRISGLALMGGVEDGLDRQAWQHLSRVVAVTTHGSSRLLNAVTGGSGRRIIRR